MLRDIVVLAERGMALDRIGVFFPAPNPYLTVIEEQFAAAGIPANGPSQRRLADSVAGRHAARCAAAAERGLAAQPGAAPRQRCPGLSARRIRAAERSGGAVAARRVVAGLADGPQAGPAARRRAAAPGRRGSGRAGRLPSIISRANSATSTSWRPSWTTSPGARRPGPGRHVVGSGGGRRGVAAPAPRRRPSPQPLARPRARRVRARRGCSHPSRCARRARTAGGSRGVRARPGRRAHTPRGRSGRFGQGVTFAPLSSAAGHDLDAVFVVGCIEGRRPSPRP